MSFRVHLDEVLQQRHFTLDASQALAAGRLQALDEEWADYKAQRSNLLLRMLGTADIPRGVYLWGSVGRGKSFLMDVFFAHVPLVRKQRVHFHAFMREVHRLLNEFRGTENPLDEVGAHIAKGARLLCFDEFHISDIADAMVLHRLLARLMSLRVGLVMTSNYAPDDLYPDGLHRDRILPAIALIKRELDVVHLGDQLDYRQRLMTQIEMYWVATDAQPLAALHQRLDAIFTRLSEADDDEAYLELSGRRIPAVRKAGGLVWFEFSVLCGGAYSQNDYLEIAAQFHTVMLSGIPKLSTAQASEARRLTWLVDVLYDRKVNLIASAQVPPDALYTEGVMAGEFMRTASRLKEMQSVQYVKTPRREA